MSIQTQINRITQAKENIISTIEEKGVVVPEGASLDDLAALISDINTVATTSQITHEDILLSEIVNTYIMNVDYNELAFDTTEIVINTTNTTSVLGQAILGQMVLA